MSETGAASNSTGSAPVHPLDQLYYVHDGQGTLGPLKGSTIRTMIESGALAPTADLNVVGEPHWTQLSQSSLLPNTKPPNATRVESGELVYAGFWPRLAAYLIDLVFTYVLSLVSGLLFGFVVGLVNAVVFKQTTIDNLLPLLKIGGGLLGFLVTIVYYANFSSGGWSATPGKRILGLYVIRQDGGRVSWLLGAGRYLAYILSSLPLFIGFLMIFWTDEKKALHDILCGTRVVWGRPGRHLDKRNPTQVF